MFGGPEGAGKTVLMTAFSYAHVKLGGKLYTFPGYEVNDYDGTKLSDMLMLQDWLNMSQDPEALLNVVLGIDELPNFFSGIWNSAITRVIRAVLAQRRKDQMGLLYTAQNYDWLPKPMKQLTHLVYNCWDMHWMPADDDGERIERGTLIRYNVCDMKGFYTGHPGQWSNVFYFHSKPYWPLYDTRSKVSIWESFRKLNILTDPLEVDLRSQKDDGEPDINLPPNPFDFETQQGMSVDEQFEDLINRGYNRGDALKEMELRRKYAERGRK
jgi:hypothetical protein